MGYSLVTSWKHFEKYGIWYQLYIYIHSAIMVFYRCQVERWMCLCCESHYTTPYKNLWTMASALTYAVHTCVAVSLGLYTTGSFVVFGSRMINLLTKLQQFTTMPNFSISGNGKNFLRYIRCWYFSYSFDLIFLKIGRVILWVSLHIFFSEFWNFNVLYFFNEVSLHYSWDSNHTRDRAIHVTPL